LWFTTAVRDQARFSAGGFSMLAGAINTSNGRAVWTRVLCHIEIGGFAGIGRKL